MDSPEQARMTIDIDMSRWKEVLKYVPNFEYWKLAPEYRNYHTKNNQVGHQQRAFILYWAIEKVLKEQGIGLDVGAGDAVGGAATPWCIGIDKYSTADHPIYGGRCFPMVQCAAEDVGKSFPHDCFNLICSNHLIEHIAEEHMADTLRGWHQVMRSGGVVIAVTPDDNQYWKVFQMDPDHKSAWTPRKWVKEIMPQVEDMFELKEIDTFKNNFSFNIVMEKKG